MVFCLACGLVAPDAAKFCPACGAEIQITKPESSNGENLIHEALGNVADSPRPRSKAPLIWGVGTFLVVIVLIIAALSGGGSNTDNSSSTPSGVDYATAIPTDEIVSTISSKLGVSINQDDPTRGITFPDISPQADIWSAPYVTLVIYPDSDSLNADNANFQRDYNNLNSNRQWDSCLNVVAIFPSRMFNKIDKALSVWCTGSTPSQLPSPANPQKLAKNILTSQDQSILSAPAGEFINTSGLTLLEAGLGNIRIDASGDLKSFVDALYVAEIRGIGSTGPITASDYQNSLQPGYGLYTMVHNVFVGYGLIAVPDELVSLAAADEAAGKNYEDYR